MGTDDRKPDPPHTEENKARYHKEPRMTFRNILGGSIQLCKVADMARIAHYIVWYKSNGSSSESKVSRKVDTGCFHDNWLRKGGHRSISFARMGHCRYHASEPQGPWDDKYCMACDTGDRILGPRRTLPYI